MTRAAKTVASMVAVAVCFAVAAVPAGAAFGIASFDGEVADAGGEAASQAALHPYVASTSIEFNSHFDPDYGVTLPDADARNITVDLPPGFVGYPTATPTQCSIEQLTGWPEQTCPASSQIGVVTIKTWSGTSTSGVFNLIPPHGRPALFGFAFSFSYVPVLLAPRLRSDGDYGISVDVRDASQAVPFVATELTLWGVPADSSHDAQRCTFLDSSVEPPACTGEPGDPLTGPRGAGTQRLPFLRNPTACTPAGVGLETTLSAEPWQPPEAVAHASFVSHEAGDPSAPLGPTGCDVVPFRPGISVRATSHQADRPTGLDVTISIPQEQNPDGLASADLKDVRVSLPEGMTVNPAAAGGLGGCSAGDYARETLGSAPGQGCPPSSKIGTVEIHTPLLGKPLAGSVYIAKQRDNPFGSLLALYIVVRSQERGVLVRLAGDVSPTPSGRLIATFENNPQLPFSSFELGLTSGERAPLVNPPSCGTKIAHATFSPWARPGERVELEDSLEVTSGPGGGPCPSRPAPLDPRLSAGAVNPVAGADSPFVLRLTREDGTQRFSTIDFSPPRGLVARLRGVPYCPESALASISSALGSGAAQLASPACPAASLVGTVTVGVGAGANPFYVETGRVYLAGPYEGAPLSLAVVAPALAGPFDLGTVTVRSAIRVDPGTARITVESDPIPEFLHGIPLDLRDVRADIARPGFTVNPTSCEPMAVSAKVTGADGTVATRAERFQLTDCATLPFKPRLTLRVRGSTRRGGHPALRAVLRARPGEANIARAQVRLPHSEFLAQSHIRTICTRVQFAADACPPGSVYGRARAFTPLLDRPLEGPVYLRSSDNPLPDLVAALDGQIEFDLVGKIDSVDGGIRTTFNTVPDAPISRFALLMQGGKRGLLENSRNLCASIQRATVKMNAHNGKLHDTHPILGDQCRRSQKRTF